MKRVKNSKSLIVGFSIWIMLPITGPAEETAPGHRVYEMEETLVTATRMEIPHQEIAANVTVINRDDIDKMPVSNAAEILQYVPGVYVEFAGGLGSQAVARIQGSDVRHVAIYQDGVPLNQLANPLTDLSYIPIDTIERIEIYKGAASSSWGSSLGGVINIITREPGTRRLFKANVHASYGEFQTIKSRGNFNGTKNRFSYLLSLTHEESDGFTEYTAYKQDAVYAKVGYELNNTSQLSFVYSYDEGRSEDPVPQFPSFWDDIYRNRAYQRLLFEMSPTDDLIFSIEGRHHRFDNKIEDVYNDHREIFNDYEDRIYGISARASWETGALNTLTVGFDEDWGRYDWAAYDREYDTRSAALYANDTLSFGAFSFNAGLRYDSNRDFGSEFSPSVGAVYRVLGGKAIVRGQIASGFSAPPAAWVHDPVYGNPDLDPEIGINYQFGGEVKPFRFLELELNLFRSDIEDLINFSFDSLRFENIGKVTRKGVEGSLRLTFDLGLTISFGGSVVDVIDDATGHEIKDIPKTIYHVMATYSNPWMTHTILGKHTNHNSTFPETRDQIFAFDYLLKAKLPLPERYGGVSLYGSVHNLTNTSYLYRRIWPQPNRRFEVGVSFMF